jgi:hypothetical protein
MNLVRHQRSIFIDKTRLHGVETGGMRINDTLVRRIECVPYAVSSSPKVDSESKLTY